MSFLSQGSWETIHQTARRSAATFDGTPKWTALQAARFKGLLLPASPRGLQSLPPPARDCAAGDWRYACWPSSSYKLSSSSQPRITLRCWTWPPFSHRRRPLRTRSEPLDGGCRGAGLWLFTVSWPPGTHLARRARDVTAICCQTKRQSHNAGGLEPEITGLGADIDPTEMFGDHALRRTDLLPLETCSLFLSHPNVF